MRGREAPCFCWMGVEGQAPSLAPEDTLVGILDVLLQSCIMVSQGWRAMVPTWPLLCQGERETTLVSLEWGGYYIKTFPVLLSCSSPDPLPRKRESFVEASCGLSS
jgi:hypothetical protein